MPTRFPALLLAFTFAGIVLAASPAPVRLFSFSPGPAPQGVIAVSPSDSFSKERGYGFEPGAELSISGSALTSSKPFYFTATLPEEGNYRVTLTVGDPAADSVMTLRAELRRLLVEGLRIPAGPALECSFTVNTRTPRIPASAGIAAGEVRLKAPRETTGEAWAWDSALTLEFNGTHPAVRSLRIEKVDKVPAVYLIGDSTVCDQMGEPFASWGQMLPRFLLPSIAVANHAESGESYRESLARRRLDKIASLLQPGDFLLMQFGHNDQKEGRSDPAAGLVRYKADLKAHIAAARAHGATPIVISSMERLSFDATGHIKRSLAAYAQAAREAAAEEQVAFIDLNALSVPFYEALEAREKGSARQAFAKGDATHQNNYGAYQLAKSIVQSIKSQQLPLARFISADFQPYDPSRPDPVGSFSLPPSPTFTNQRPLGDP
jgi:lysophospholipase L1-like esterase